MQKLVLQHLIHNNKQQIALIFEKDIELIAAAKYIGALWSQSNKCWYIPNSSENLKKIFCVFKGKALIDSTLFFRKPQNKTTIASQIAKPIELAELTEEKKQKIEKFILWMRSKRYSESTINTYSGSLSTFLRYFADKEIKDIDNEDLVHFDNHYILANNYSASYQNQFVNGIKLFFKKIAGSVIDIKIIHRPKRAKQLPNVLSKEEVKAILNSLKNIKHKALLSLIYSCGLRSGEALRLKPENVDSKRNILIIKNSKGKKDRIVPLSEKIIVLLREYYIIYKPQIYLFEGAKAGAMYDERSLQQVLKKSLTKAGIKKPVTLHWLRHSYATHLLENGTNLRYIQEILGHSHSKTTEIYTHVSTKSIQKIISPFDYL
ncbi:MAG: site-specific integrase [Bacteroidota bacterium]|nr:site-specific integrase [Bacteroidota bacterium]